MKRVFFLIFFITSLSFSTTSVYNFNLKGIKLKECKLSRKESGDRDFEGIIYNKTGSNLDWILLEFYFRDKNINKGKYLLVATKKIKDIPLRTNMRFKINNINVGDIDGRDFKIKLKDKKVE